MGLGLVLLALVLFFARQPLEDLRNSRLAAELAERYDIVVRYGDPAEFYLPPYPPAGDIIAAEPVDRRHLRRALLGVETALAVYPPGLVRQHLAAVFIAGTLKLKGVPAAGTYFYAWIYVSAADDLVARGAGYIAETIHHELSSLLFLSGAFPEPLWAAVNDPGFSYLEDPEAVIEAAGQYRDPAEAEQWHEAGFVSDYGMSSMENDVNTFAELAFGRPEKLEVLAARYPRIAAKLRILTDFYTGLAPELGGYFTRTGLISAAKPAS